MKKIFILISVIQFAYSQCEEGEIDLGWGNCNDLGGDFTVPNGCIPSGYKSVQWNTTNNQGHSVSSGVYFYTIQTVDFRQTKRMILLK